MLKSELTNNFGVCIRKLKNGINSCWAKYRAFRVMFMVAFLIFITIIAFLTFNILHEYSPMLSAIFVWLTVISAIVISIVRRWRR